MLPACNVDGTMLVFSRNTVMSLTVVDRAKIHLVQSDTLLMNLAAILELCQLAYSLINRLSLKLATRGHMFSIAISP